MFVMNYFWLSAMQTLHGIKLWLCQRDNDLHLVTRQVASDLIALLLICVVVLYFYLSGSFIIRVLSFVLCSFILMYSTLFGLVNF